MREIRGSNRMAALDRLSRAGVSLGCQTVLLNELVQNLNSLLGKLLRIDVNGASYVR